MITENYIKMCEKAKEIQDNWKPKNGDKFFAERAIWYIGNSFLRDKDPLIVTHVAYTYSSSIENPKIWLPTQEDLQSMIKNSVPLGLIKVLYYQIYETIKSKLNFDYYSKFKSMQEIWLAFVYKELYLKVWSIEEWIKS